MKRRMVVVLGVVGFLGLLSAATGFGAEATRIKISQVKFNAPDSPISCSFPRSPALHLGLTAAAALLIAHIIVNVETGCFCCRRGPRPSNSKWTIALVSFVVSCTQPTGAALNQEHSGENVSFGNYGYYCFVVKPGVFAGGAVLSLATVGLGILSYLTITSAKNNNNINTNISAGNQGGSIAMGQPQIPTQGPHQDPVFVHEDTYMRRQFT